MQDFFDRHGASIVIIVVGIVIAIGMFRFMDYYDKPDDSEFCDNCHAIIMNNDIQKYHCEVEANYNIVQAANHYSYSGTIEGNQEAKGFLIYHYGLYNGSGNLSGEISEEETYSFFYETSDGGYKKMSVPVDRASIYFTNEQPHVEILHEYGNYGVCSECKKANYSWDSISYKIYVPEGSIEEEYNFD